MLLLTAAFFPTHSSEHNTYYVAPELNIQHKLNQQAHKTTNNIEWNQPLRLVIFYNAEHHIQQYTTRTPKDGHIDVRNMWSYLW